MFLRFHSKDYMHMLFPFVTDDGVPTNIQSNIYIESFGNIEEANMVSMLCDTL